MYLSEQVRNKTDFNINYNMYKTGYVKITLLTEENVRKKYLKHFRGKIFWGMSVDLFIDIVWADICKHKCKTIIRRL